MAVKGLMMHQKLTCTGMVVNRTAVLQPRIIVAAKKEEELVKMVKEEARRVWHVLGRW
jgi:hypothetical protein